MGTTEMLGRAQILVARMWTGAYGDAQHQAA